MRLSILLCALGFADAAFAQERLLPPPQIAHAPAAAPRGRLLTEEPSPPRDLFHMGGGFGILIHGRNSTGYQQLETIGYDTPIAALHLNAGAQLVATPWLRLGTELSYAFVGSRTDRNYRSVERTEGMGFHMGIVDLTLTPYLRAGVLQLGLRLAGGYGFSRWVHNSIRGSTSGVFRVSAGVDLYMPLVRRSTSGLNIRLGYQLRRTTATGPLGLVFDQSGLFLNFAYMFGAGT